MEFGRFSLTSIILLNVNKPLKRSLTIPFKNKRINYAKYYLSRYSFNFHYIILYLNESFIRRMLEILQSLLYGIDYTLLKTQYMRPVIYLGSLAIQWPFVSNFDYTKRFPRSKYPCLAKTLPKYDATVKFMKPFYIIFLSSWSLFYSLFLNESYIGIKYIASLRSLMC